MAAIVAAPRQTARPPTHAPARLAPVSSRTRIPPMPPPDSDPAAATAALHAGRPRHRPRSICNHGPPPPRQHAAAGGGCRSRRVGAGPGRAGTAAAPRRPRSAAPLSWRIGFEELRLPGGEQLGLVGTSVLVGFGGLVRRPGRLQRGNRPAWRPVRARRRRAVARRRSCRQPHRGRAGGRRRRRRGGACRRRADAAAAPRMVVAGRSGLARHLGIARAVSERQHRQQPARHRAELRRPVPAHPRRCGTARARAAGAAQRLRLRSTVARRSAATGCAAPSRTTSAACAPSARSAPGVWVGLETNGAAQGAADGYAELLGTLGIAWPLWQAEAAVGGAADRCACGARRRRRRRGVDRRRRARQARRDAALGAAARPDRRPRGRPHPCAGRPPACQPPAAAARPDARPSARAAISHRSGAGRAQ